MRPANTIHRDLRPFEGAQLLAMRSGTLTMRLLEDRREELLNELRAIAPELVAKLELTLEALREQSPEKMRYYGLGRGEVIRKYLESVGRPACLREISKAVAAPASRFTARSIWDGAKRAIQQGQLLNVADAQQGETWTLALPEWQPVSK